MKISLDGQYGPCSCWRSDSKRCNQPVGRSLREWRRRPIYAHTPQTTRSSTHFTPTPISRLITRTNDSRKEKSLCALRRSPHRRREGRWDTDRTFPLPFPPSAPPFPNSIKQASAASTTPRQRAQHVRQLILRVLSLLHFARVSESAPLNNNPNTA